MRLAALLLLLSTAFWMPGCNASGTLIVPGSATADDDDDASDDDDAVGDDDDAVGDDDDSVNPGSLARGIDIASVSLNQSVQVMLVDDGTLVGSPNVVRGRAGLLRLHLEPQPEWQERTIIATLTWSSGASGAADLDLEQEITPTGPSSDGDLDSTANFEIPASAIRTGATWSVSLRELDGGSGAGNASAARWPRIGGAETLSTSTAGTLKVLVIPIEYNADGSGRLPDTSGAQIELLADWLYRVYPTEEVEITVDEPLAIGFQVFPDGTNWGDLLYEITDVREDRNVPADTYLYGMFRPTNNAGQFCGSGCVAGLSWRADSPNDEWSRASVGLGYGGEGAAGTMIHEVGHAHGRSHAPCGLSESDPSYPHSEGRLGAWGRDPLSGEMKSPEENRDMMGYCTPRWVSDYTWEALIDRVGWVNANAEWVNAPPELPWRIVGVGVGGERTARGTIPVTGVPSGEAVHVDWLDASGTVVGVAEGRYRAFEHIPGGTVLMPEPPADVVATVIDGEVVPLPR